MRFIVHGQRHLEGTLTPVGNKNAALPMLAASVLTDRPITLKNVPLIKDVLVMLDILEDLGVSVEQKGRTFTLCARSLKKTRLDPTLCHLVRSSILFAGPLTARHGNAHLHPPGGDVIGHRCLDTHLHGLRTLGTIIKGGRSYSLTAKQLKGSFILFDEASVTATENIMMAATLAQGTTTLYNAACEPHVHDLGLLLNKMGAQISGLGTNCVKIKGVKQLNGATHTIGPDYIEIGSFVAAAAATKGSLTIQTKLDPLIFPILERTFRKLGICWKSSGKNLILSNKQTLRIQKDVGSSIPKIEDGTWPAFPSDLMSVVIVLSTQLHGTILFFEKLFESRMYFVDQLIGMGAQIVQCDPHRVLVNGPARLHGYHMASPDIRAGMALVIAALCAKGKSIIENAQVIDRGYERIDEKLQALGADIVRED
ncbi:MAG: UDP-N-acetylglucosamine 1-carboxyvinyltransferase [Kiritimatiellae bacterium]|nr:UDP-N-acetylglucosamine 1-carboxyvinyltransferase [Kiritimatiellia bacterium]